MDQFDDDDQEVAKPPAKPQSIGQGNLMNKPEAQNNPFPPPGQSKPPSPKISNNFMQQKGISSGVNGVLPFQKPNNPSPPKTFNIPMQNNPGGPKPGGGFPMQNNPGGPKPGGGFPMQNNPGGPKPGGGFPMQNNPGGPKPGGGFPMQNNPEAAKVGLPFQGINAKPENLFQSDPQPLKNQLSAPSVGKSAIQPQPKPENPLFPIQPKFENKPNEPIKATDLPISNHLVQNTDFSIKQEKPVSRLVQQGNPSMVPQFKEISNPQILKNSDKILSAEQLVLGPAKLPNGNIKKSTDLVLSLVKILMFNSKPSIQEAKSIEAQSSHPSFIRTFPELFCDSCKGLAFMFKLDCSHSACLTCLRNSLTNLVNNPTPSNFSQSRCQECFSFPSKANIHRIFNSEPVASTILSLQIPKQCLWCKRSLNLFTGYYPELECLHLCRECYTTELFYGGKKCICCSNPYKTKEITLQRVDKCTGCGDSGNVIAKAFKVPHLDHVLCYECQKRSIVGGAIVCVTCKTNVSGNDKSAFLCFFNRVCPQCTNIVNAAEIAKCNKCPRNVCDECNGKSGHVCCEGIS